MEQTVDTASETSEQNEKTAEAEPQEQTGTAEPSEAPKEAPKTEEAPKKKGKQKKKRTAKSFAIELLIKLALTVLVLWIVLSFVAGVFVCHSNSAYPMIKDGDLCITWRLGKLEQGSEIVYEHEGKNCFGRVLAVAGDEVNIAGDSVMVNGYVALTDTVYPTPDEGSKISYPYIVPEGCVFVLNDFREDMSDSRSFGGVPLDDCKGKVIFVMRRRGI